MGVNLAKDLTVSNILEEISEYDIFKTYCLPFGELDKFFTSEIREDNKPTAKIFVNENDDLIYHDFNGSSHNCFTYVKEKYGTDFNTVLNIINRDFKLNLRYTWGNKKETLETQIQPKLYTGKKRTGSKVTILTKRKREWSLDDEKYWDDKYSISISTLEHFNVEPIDFYWINRSRFKCHTVTYSYEFGNGARDIYAPLAEAYRWPASTTRANTHIYGLKQLPETGDLLFITSSNKEVMFLYGFDINSIAPQSETVFIAEKILADLRVRFKRIIIMYDFDKPGCVQASKQANKHNLEYMKFCPVMIQEYNAKDLTDAYEIDNNKILNLLDNYEKYL